jgi:hypothetical protein
MPHGIPHILEAPRLPELVRAVCRYTGVPPPLGPDSGERFILRCGAEPAGLFAELLAEAFAEDGADVPVFPAEGSPDYGSLHPSRVAVRPGYEAPCPEPDGLRRAAGAEGGTPLLFAVERRDPAGRLVGVTWVALSEQEPAPEAAFRAAVLRHDSGDGAGA